MSYIDGFIVAVPTTNKQIYKEHAEKAWEFFKEQGALRLVEGWGDEVPVGKVTDFPRSVQAKDDETVMFSWIEWPSKEIRNAAHQKMAEDPRMKIEEMPFDGMRLIYGGFTPLLDAKG